MHSRNQSCSKSEKISDGHQEKTPGNRDPPVRPGAPMVHCTEKFLSEVSRNSGPNVGHYPLRSPNR